MNNKNEVLSKKNIVMYAKKIRDIESQQIEPYLQLISEHLLDLYPGLSEEESYDWACDIINTTSNSEVAEVLDRIEEIQESKVKEKWVCHFCGENTYDVDCENLAGVDHLSCLIKHELESKSNSTLSVNELKESISRLQFYVKQLEQQIEQLEGQYNEPTN